MEMTIGKLATAAGVGVETIRFYERKGILKRPKKTIGYYRTYAPITLSQIRFTKRAQELGFTLKEVKALLELQEKRAITGCEVQLKAQEKIKEIQLKIKDLKQMESSLKRLAKLCGDGTSALGECKIFECFDNKS